VKQGSLITEAGQRNKHLQELNRFIHYYTRYKNHDNSRLMEEPLLNSARRKMELLAASLPAGRSPILYHSHAVKSSSQSSNQVPACTRFIEEGIRELIQARRIHSDPLTLCLIKPHSIQEGKIGKIIANIQENGYTIAGLRMHRLSLSDAELFFEAYKDVWEDHPAHIKHFTSGPVIAIAVASDVNTFRDFAGPFDPVISR